MVRLAFLLLTGGCVVSGDKDRYQRKKNTTGSGNFHLRWVVFNEGLMNSMMRRRRRIESLHWHDCDSWALYAFPGITLFGLIFSMEYWKMSQRATWQLFLSFTAVVGKPGIQEHIFIAMSSITFILLVIDTAQISSSPSSSSHPNSSIA